MTDDTRLAGTITVASGCITAFSFATNGYQGGDGGNGGYLEIIIDGGSSTMMSIAVDGEPMPRGGSGDHASFPGRLRDEKTP